jgi:aspartate/methionine/tyrosine aminotransferase
MKASLSSERVNKLSVSPIRRFLDLALEMKNIIRLDLGEPDFPVASHIKEAAHRAIDQDFSHYTTNVGLIELRKSIARKMARENGIRVDPEQGVIVTKGATSALFQAIQATINPGDEVLLPDPGWPQYTPIVELAGGVPVYYPLLEKDFFVLDVASVEKLNSPKIRLILLNSPNNPTGGVMGGHKIKALARLARKYDLLILSDEVYEKIIYEGEHFSIGSLDETRNYTITVNACSKTYAMTGWRIGMLRGRRKLSPRCGSLCLTQTPLLILSPRRP